MFTVILFYKYVDIKDPEAIRIIQRSWCEELGLTGRVLIAQEGINATLEGSNKDILSYIKRMDQHKLFDSINYKKSAGNGACFAKLQVKVRTEIVATKIEDKDLGPLGGVTGAYLEAKELRNWYQSKKDFVVIDMRNEYEYEVGRFKNSVMPSSLKNFRDLAKILPEIEHLKNKTVVAVCTGGVRCEKASGFLKKNGFGDVYQLHNGIHTYMEEYPNTDFEGKLLVFDGRVLWTPSDNTANHTIVGKCKICSQTSENMINWYESGSRKYGIVCKDCIADGALVLDAKGTHYHLPK